MNNNYTYIIASIPALKPDFKPEGGSVKSTVEWIVSQLEGKDAEAAQTLIKGRDPSGPDADFYKGVFSGRNAFLKEYFGADLRLRNAKVRHINAALSRPAEMDTVQVDGAPKGDDAGKLETIFKETDLLKRERDIDDFMWNTADSLTLFKYFTLDNVLAIMAKLLIIERWLALDPEQGRALLRNLVTDVRGTYGKIEFNNIG